MGKTLEGEAVTCLQSTPGTCSFCLVLPEPRKECDPPPQGQSRVGGQSMVPALLPPLGPSLAVTHLPSCADTTNSWGHVAPPHVSPSRSAQDGKRLLPVGQSGINVQATCPLEGCLWSPETPVVPALGVGAGRGSHRRNQPQSVSLLSG